jgi:hypothetical protein
VREPGPAGEELDVSFIRLAVMTAAYAAGACVVAWAAGMVALAGLAPVPALLLKTVLVTLVLVGVTWRGMAVADTRRRDVAVVALAALVGFVADPFTWAARTYAGQLVADAGVATLVLDLVLWLVVVVGVAAVARRDVRTAAYA